MSGQSLETCKSNLKSVALTVLNWSDWSVGCAQRHTHTQTHIEWKQYLCHSLRSLGRDNKEDHLNAVMKFTNISLNATMLLTLVLLQIRVIFPGHFSHWSTSGISRQVLTLKSNQLAWFTEPLPTATKTFSWQFGITKHRQVQGQHSTRFFEPCELKVHGNPYQSYRASFVIPNTPHLVSMGPYCKKNFTIFGQLLTACNVIHRGVVQA